MVTSKQEFTVKRSNALYICVSSMNGEPLTKGNMKALEALQAQAQIVVKDSGGQRLVISTGKD